MSDKSHYPDGITAELLMAYADGALNDEDATIVEAALEKHPDLSGEVENFRLTREALAGIFDSPLREPVPGHLESLVMQGAEKRDVVVPLHKKHARNYAALPLWGQAIAASVVFAIGAMFGALVLKDNPQSVAMDQLFAGRLEPKHPVSQALETTPSAQAVEFSGARFEAVATFSTSSGYPCREFEAVYDNGAAVGIACRRDGAWTVELLLHAEPGTGKQQGFQLASSFNSEVLDTILTDLGAGAGLSAKRETCLLKNGWQAASCD